MVTKSECGVLKKKGKICCAFKVFDEVFVYWEVMGEMARGMATLFGPKEYEYL
jgi:hypothetical protein